MRQQITANGYLDFLTKSELDNSLGHSLDSAVRDLYRGIDYLQYAAQGNGTGLITLPYSPESGYSWSIKLVAAQLAPSTTTPSPNTPAVPASGVAVQNTNLYPVNVTISGGTLTAVAVNGITVGTGDGTYLVPSGAAISMTYSVAPTWAWAGIATTNTPILSVYPSTVNTVAPIAAIPATINGGNVEAVQTWSSNAAVLKDSAGITLYCATANINTWRIMVEQVPTEMQGKL